MQKKQWQGEILVAKWRAGINSGVLEQAALITFLLEMLPLFPIAQKILVQNAVGSNRPLCLLCSKTYVFWPLPTSSSWCQCAVDAWPPIFQLFKLSGMDHILACMLAISHSWHALFPSLGMDRPNFHSDHSITDYSGELSQNLWLCGLPTSQFQGTLQFSCDNYQYL